MAGEAEKIACNQLLGYPAFGAIGLANGGRHLRVRVPARSCRAGAPYSVNAVSFSLRKSTSTRVR